MVSVSHKTTTIDVLAKLAMDQPTTGKLADAVMASDHVDEVVVLSTCNRTEIYASISRFHGGLDDITTELAEFASLSANELRRMCAVYFDEGAVAHTFGVVSGLDSMVIGENQILGQAKAALTHAQQCGTVGTVLNSLFQQGNRVGKRVHSETSIGSAGRSLVTAAYGLLEAQGGGLAGRRVAVIGAGSMASLAARTAAAAGAQVTCLNRTLSKAHRLADAIGGTALPLSALPDALQHTDIVVACTGARDLTITAEQLAGTPVSTVIDLALPADVDPGVAELGIDLINLARLVDSSVDSATAAEVEAARELVRGEVQDFLGLRRAAQVAPTVVALRSMASEVVAAEMARLDSKLPELDETERAEIHRAVRRVVEKLLHTPTVRVQELAAEPESVDYAAALRELFALDPQAVAAVMSPEVGP